MAHDKDSLINDLRRLGLSEGDGLWVHASMRAIGSVDGGAETLIEALQTVIGDTGLLGMPGFSDDACFPAHMDRATLTDAEIARIEHQVTGYDAATSPTAGMGILAETFRTWPGTRRSAHATTSVCLNGHDADDLIAPHDAPWAMGPASPFGRMRDRAGMKILLIGVGWNRCTPLHTAEDYAVPKRTKTRRFKTGQGDAPWQETPDVADDLGRLFPAAGDAFEDTGHVMRGTLGAADVRLCGYDDLIRFAALWIGAQNRESGDRH
ncbi:MAG: AAC(3) family N-acetyltransferase [Pseudomonadota bacterium]